LAILPKTETLPAKNIGTYGWHRFTVWRRQKSRVPHFAFPKIDLVPLAFTKC
jgi:hypothetical protein